MTELVSLIPTRKKCPRCKKGALDTRAHRSFLVKVLLFWLPVRRYKCNNCGKKAYVFGSTLTMEPSSGGLSPQT